MENSLKKAIISLLIVSLISSILLNIVLFKKAKHYYNSVIILRSDPLGLKNYPADADYNTEENLNYKRVVFLGDSRAYQWVVTTNSPKQYQFINRGIGAQTSVQVVSRFDEHVKPLKPDIIVVQVGINDLKEIPLFDSKKELIVTNCKKNIALIVSKSIEIGSTVILTTIFPVGKIPIERRLFWSDDIYHAIYDINDYIHSQKRSNVIIMDTFAILANEKGIVRSEYRMDFLHINAAGYSALNDELQKILRKLEK